MNFTIQVPSTTQLNIELPILVKHKYFDEYLKVGTDLKLKKVFIGTENIYSSITIEDLERMTNQNTLENYYLNKESYEACTSDQFNDAINKVLLCL